MIPPRSDRMVRDFVLGAVLQLSRLMAGLAAAFLAAALIGEGGVPWP